MEESDTAELEPPDDFASGEFDESAGFSVSNISGVLAQLPPIQTPKIPTSAMVPKKSIPEPTTKPKKSSRDSSGEHHEKKKRLRKSTDDKPYEPSKSIQAAEVRGSTIDLTGEATTPKPRQAKTQAKVQLKSFCEDSRRKKKAPAVTYSEEEAAAEEEQEEEEESASVSDLSDDSDGEINIHDIAKRVHKKEADKRSSRKKAVASKSAKSPDTSAASSSRAARKSTSAKQQQTSATASATEEPRGDHRTNGVGGRRPERPNTQHCGSSGTQRKTDGDWTRRKEDQTTD